MVIKMNKLLVIASKYEGALLKAEASSKAKLNFIIRLLSEGDAHGDDCHATEHKHGG